MNTPIVMAMGKAPATSGAAAGAAAADPMAGIMSLLPLVIIFVLFYVLFIMPQRKQQKQHQALLKALKKGDEVLTTGGMFATIVGFNEPDNTVLIKLGDTKVEIQRASIAGLRKAPGITEKK